MRQSILFLLALLFTAQVGYAQASTATSVMTLNITPYVQLDNATLPAAIATLGQGLDPANNILAGAVRSHTVGVLTNSATGADLTLAITGTGGGSASAWDNVTIDVTQGAGPVVGTTASAGSSSGTFNARTCTDDCSAQLVTDMIGGNYTYEVQFQVTLGNRFALAGTRSFNAVYTVSL